MNARALGLLAMMGSVTSCGSKPSDVESVQGALHIFQTQWDAAFAICPKPDIQVCGGNFGLSMHCCPPGWAMLGGNFTQNSFKCGQVLEDPGQESCVLDGSTQRMGMKACPFGMYMKGHHAAQNKSICCTRPDGYVAQQDDVTQIDGDNERTREGGATTNDWHCIPVSGHVCPNPTSVLVGVHIGLDYLLCE